MRKIVLLLLPIIIIGCEQTFDNIIDAVQNNYQVSLVSPTDSITFREDDSLVTIRIIFTSSSEVSDVFCDVFASDNSKLNSSKIQLFDDNDNNRFLNEFPLSQYYPNGIYNIKYYVKNADENMQQVAIGSFKYNNGQDNLPPEIANTVVDPDTVVVTAPTVILTSVEASDPNGQNDILKVYFIVYNPDGSTNGNELELFDDGNVDDHGDLMAGDGIYSLLIQVDQANEKGTYRFEFRARDRGGKLSNTIDHTVLIQ
ncbi:choice-of-anchor X domain-containing protein [Bacteroidota bacterium]